MHINRFLQRAPSYLDQRIAIHLIGSSGIGKSDACNWLRQSLSQRDKEEWGISTINLMTQTPPDVNGYLMGVTREIEVRPGKKEQVLISEFSLPPHMISDTGRPMNSYKRGFVFFDERGQADLDVKKAAAPVILEGRAGRHRLHEGIGVISASNSREHRSGVTREFDFLINRETWWTIKPHVPSWRDWATRTGIHPLWITYAITHPQVVFADQHPEEQGPWCTPRSFVRFCKILQADFMNALLDPDARDDIMEEAVGMIGLSASEDLLTWVKVKTEVPEPDEVAKNPGKAMVPTRPDAMLLVTYALAAHITKKNSAALVEYILRLPPEFSLTFATAAIARDRASAGWEAIRKNLAGKNAALVNMLAAL